MSVKHIIEGWKNHLLPHSALKDMIDTVSKERLEICRKCPFHRDPFDRSVRPDEHCHDCGCSLTPKTKCLSCSCPQGNWGEEITPEEEKTINDEKNIQD